MRYVALLRGIMPTNPNMKGEKLREVFERLGFTNVRTVIASGNVVFDSLSKNPAALEKKIEAALLKQLGFSSATMIRSQKEIEALVARNPFKGIKDEKPNYLIVTFFKDRQKELCTVLNLNQNGTPEFMTNIKKKHGKALTTRTWKTIHRITATMHKE